MEKETIEVENNETELKDSVVYEISYLIDPNLEEDALSTVVNSIKNLFESKGGIFVSDGWPKKMVLSYEIFISKDGKKASYDSAYFGWQKYELSPDSIGEVKSEIDKSDSVLRLMIIKTTKEDIAPFKPRPVHIESKDASKEPISISKEELDKTIEELVID